MNTHIYKKKKNLEVKITLELVILLPSSRKTPETQGCLFFHYVQTYPMYREKNHCIFEIERIHTSIFKLNN